MREAALRYREDIDGLRAIAVGSVVFFHAGIPGFSGGFVGVDVFFVISGFLITTIIRDGIQTETFTLAEFYDRRIRRIFPILFAVYLVSFVAGIIILLPDDLKALGKSLIASAVFGANIHFHDQAGYFDAPSIAKPLLHTWSLSVEEQFYVLWPLAMLAFARYVPVRHWPAALCAIIALSLAYAQWEISRENAKAAFYMPHARAWELMLGALIALAHPAIRISRMAREGLGAGGLILIAGSVALLSEGMDFPGLNALFPCVGAAMVIVSGINGPTFAGRLLSNPPAVFIGLISYSLYLWHWPIFSYWHITMERAPSLAEALALIGASVALAALSWKYIERPFRRGAASLPAVPKISIRAGFAAITIAMLSGFAVSHLNGLPGRYGPEVVAIIETAATRSGKNCAYEGPDISTPSECLLGQVKSEGPHDVVLIGDSHARHFSPAIDGVLDDAGIAGRYFSAGGCIVLAGVRVYDNGKPRGRCRDYEAGVKEFLARDTQAALIVMATRWQIYTEEERSEQGANNSRQLADDIDLKPGDRATTRRVLERGIRRTIEALVARGKRVLLIGQVPPYPAAPTNCVVRAITNGRDIQDC